MSLVPQIYLIKPGHLPLVLLVLALVLLGPLSPVTRVQAEETATSGSGIHRLVVQGVEVLGNTRTRDEVVQQELGLEPGAEVGQNVLLDAVASTPSNGIIVTLVLPGTKEGPRPAS